MARIDLLNAVLDDIGNNGIADRSLREIATAVGSSHRMLIYHFGSRAGLVEAVVHEMAERSRRHDTELFGADGRDGLRDRWERLRSNDNEDSSRLFFELAAIAMRHSSETARFREEYVEPWLQMSEQVASDYGVPPAIARAMTRLDTAVIRGLLHDVLITGDDEEVERAFRNYAAIRRQAIDTQLAR